MDDIFLRLDVEGIRDFPAELGAFSSESLCVRYNFTLDEYHSALMSIAGADELPDHLKTVVHETTHLFHATTTPFGLLIHRLRWLQAYLVIEAIRMMRRHGCRVSFPLVKGLQRLPTRVAKEVKPLIQVWYGVEYFILVMFGDTDAWEQHFHKNPFLRGVSVAELFAHIQYYIAQHYVLEERVRRTLLGAEGQLGAMPDMDGFTLDEVNLTEQVDDEGVLLVTDLLGGGTNALAIIESAGTAAEFWGRRRLSLDQFKATIAGAPWASTMLPKSWLVWARNMVRASSLAEFILSYLVICEVALFGPVLPQHQRLRNGRINMRELVPYFRWVELLNAASAIPPLTSLGDYERYTAALCEALGWASPKAIVDATMTSSREPPIEPYERMYWTAQAVRRQVPGAFLDYPFLVLGTSPEARRCQMEFTFPVIQYRDKTLFHKDKARLGLFIIGYLMRAVARKMLLRSDLAVALPYPPLEAEKTAFATELGDMLEALLGYRVAGISVS